MFDRIREFVEEMTGVRRQGEPEAEVDERVAAAALLVHAVAVDGSIDDIEKAKMSELLQAEFELSPRETSKLIDDARKRDLESVDLYGFTSVLNRQLDEDGRHRIVEMLWEIVYADGVVHEFEDNMIWRVAELLGVSTRARMTLKKRVAGSGEGDAND